MARFKIIPPAEHLKNHVAYFWYAAMEHMPGEQYLYNAVASSKPELLFRYAGDYAIVEDQHIMVPDAGFFGQSNQFKNYKALSGRTGFFGVRFYPQALLELFNIPAVNITNGSADIISMLGREGLELSSKVLVAQTFSERIDIITHFLETKLDDSSGRLGRMETAFQLIRSSDGQVSINDLMKRTYLSERQFERNFKSLAGFPARTYLNIIRFENLLDNLNSQAGPKPASLTSIALDSGYYDQAHLNHHFKLFTGHAPLDYLKVRRPLQRV